MPRILSTDNIHCRSSLNVLCTQYTLKDKNTMSLNTKRAEEIAYWSTEGRSKILKQYIWHLSSNPGMKHLRERLTWFRNAHIGTLMIPILSNCRGILTWLYKGNNFGRNGKTLTLQSQTRKTFPDERLPSWWNWRRLRYHEHDPQ